MKHLITGGAGFIGSHLTKRLVDRGERVVVIDDLSGGFKSNLDDRAEFIEGDLTVMNLDEVFASHKPVYVWHLAAYAAEGLSHWVRGHNVRNNWIATTRLINEAVKHGVERFLFTSSMAVYGSQSPPFTEKMTPRPEDPYGIAKHACEQDLEAARRVFGLDYTIFRPHNVYGPGQNIGDKYRNVVGIFMRQALAGDPITVFGDGRQTRAFSYISDIVRPMVAGMDTPGVFNIGGEEPVTIMDLASRVSKLFGGAGIVNLEERTEVKHAWCDHTAAKTHLGFEPTVGFDDGLGLMAEWVKAEGVRWTTTPPLELSTRLPEFWQ